MPASRIKVFPHNRSALVEIHRPALVDELKALAEADGFEEKDEFHVTLLPALDVLDDDNRRELEAFQIALHDKLVDDIRIINDINTLKLSIDLFFGEVGNAVEH